MVKKSLESLLTTAHVAATSTAGVAPASVKHDGVAAVAAQSAAGAAAIPQPQVPSALQLFIDASAAGSQLPATLPSVGLHYINNKTPFNNKLTLTMNIFL